jgi:hypothetical protein
MLKAEKETTITWDSQEKIVRIFSCHRPLWRRAERRGFQPTRVQTQNGREVGRFYRIPLTCFRYGFRAMDRPRRPAPKGAFKSKKRGKTSQKRGGSFKG